MEVSRAVAALRCLPCLVGSFATTEDARRGAVGRTLGLIDELLVACSAPGMPRVEGEGGADAIAFDSSPSSKKRHGKRRKSKGDGKDKSKGDTPVRIGGGGEQQAGFAVHGEVAVMRAYALEAGVGLCCLLPADGADGSREAGRVDTLEKLIGWHDR